MGHILEEIKKKIFFLSVWTYTNKAIVWVIFWRNLKKKDFTFCMDVYYKGIVWVIFWRKLKNKILLSV
jgi:hypothetical protein